MVERGRVLRAHRKEGLALACASERNAPASAGRRALRNMAADGGSAAGRWRSKSGGCNWRVQMLRAQALRRADVADAGQGRAGDAGAGEPRAMISDVAIIDRSKRLRRLPGEPATPRSRGGAGPAPLHSRVGGGGARLDWIRWTWDTAVARHAPCSNSGAWRGCQALTRGVKISTRPRPAQISKDLPACPLLRCNSPCHRRGAPRTTFCSCVLCTPRSRPWIPTPSSSTHCAASMHCRRRPGFLILDCQ